MGQGGLSFARKQQQSFGQPLNAKKLDIDFGTDDFFNSFGQGSQPKPEAKISNKLKEVDDTFAIGKSTTGLNANPFGIDLGSASTAQENHLSDEQAKQKLAKLANRKAISSEDFKNDEPTPEIQMRYQAMKASGAT